MKEFAQCAFGRAVVSVGYSGLLQTFSCGIYVHVDASCHALGYIKEYLPHAGGLFHDGQEPFLRRCVSRSICLDYHGTCILAAQDRMYDLRGDAGMYLQNGYSCVKILVEYRSHTP